MKHIKISNKTYIITAVLAAVMFLLSSVSVFADTSRSGNTFKVEQASKNADTQTKYTWEDKEGNSYPIFITKRGACYINRVSKKTGKEYKYYLPKEVQEQIKKELGYEN
jgi:uncharacterized membrane protein